MKQGLKDEVIAISKSYIDEWKQRTKNECIKVEKSKVLVSGIVICKNEEKNISGCIEAMLNSEFDEILIVDTGSEDRTKEIVLKYSLQYLNIVCCHYQWMDSFAQARNFGIDHAAYDWVFFLDADERIIKTEDTSIQSLISYYSSICGNTIAIAPVIINSKANKLYGNPRIFNRKMGYRYYGNVHEMLRGLEEKYDPVPFICLNIKVEHNGYINNIIYRKIERNLKLLEKSISSEPLNPIWYCYKLRDGRDVLDDAEKYLIYKKIRELCIKRLKENFYQYCLDWAITMILPEAVYKKDYRLIEELNEDAMLFCKCNREDKFYLESLIKLAKIDQDLLYLEEKCSYLQQEGDFSTSIINTEGYHIDELKLIILEKEHKMGDYFKLKDFLFNIGYIQEIE